MSQARALAIGLLFALAGFAVNTSANAADPQFCDGYAKKAFKTAKLNQQLNCGFQGPRWILDKNGHRAWCLIVPENIADVETQAREAEMKGCICNWYADKAMAQVNENKARNCGFGGLRWIDIRQGHYDWCFNSNPGMDAMKSEIDARKKMLKGC